MQIIPKCRLSMLTVGQAVSLKDHGAAYRLSFFEDEVSLSHTAVEVCKDYVIVRDIAGVKETLVPVFAVKAIEKVRAKVE